MKKITVYERQSIWDIAVQEYGSMNGVAQLCADNQDLVNFAVRIPKGTQLFIDETKIINPVIVDYFSKKNLKPATCDTGPDWILADGTWNDAGVWDDSENWND